MTDDRSDEYTLMTMGSPSECPSYMNESSPQAAVISTPVYSQKPLALSLTPTRSHQILSTQPSCSQTPLASSLTPIRYHQILFMIRYFSTTRGRDSRSQVTDMLHV